MSSVEVRDASGSEQASCWLCGRMLKTGYHFVCHTCGATYCYSHMPERCTHVERSQLPTAKELPSKA